MPMARAAKAAGFRIALAARLGAAAPGLEAEGIRLIPLELRRGTLNPAHVIGECAALARLVRRERPDILHLIALKPIAVGGLAGLFAPVPTIINSITGVGFLGIGGSAKVALARAILWPLIAVLLGRANSWILSDNHDDARILGRRASHPITHVGGAGIDPDHFAELPLPDGATVRAAVVARMLWSKGIDTVVEAQRRLRQRGVELDLTLAGPVEEGIPNALSRATLERWSAQPGISWIGPQADVRTVWRDADIAVLASRGGEGLPRALLEAAACGRPMITTDVPGCRDFVRSGEEGLIVPPDDPPALAAALETLVRDRDLRRRMATAARARVVAGFTEQQIAAAVVALYQRACAGSATK
jgi:glycosyltransferase involved in cell wall biosynthesis